ncbi:hypothetical protein K438DRAFT_1749788 [Mycena galopus ATCC 62051]|nr:hypothetical protein K438DRAFT_1749788 [Mycena galopus ATCC 62051]
MSYSHVRGITRAGLFVLLFLTAGRKHREDTTPVVEGGCYAWTNGVGCPQRRVESAPLRFVTLCLAHGITNMSKRKVFVNEDDFNDGSGSDDSTEGYVPRNRVLHVEHVPTETVTITNSGKSKSTHSTVEIPASPAKKMQARAPVHSSTVPLLRDAGGQHDWDDEDFSAFDAEYGVGIDDGPRAARDSVS